MIQVIVQPLLKANTLILITWIGIRARFINRQVRKQSKVI